jgi:hypothetical protein
MADRYWVGGSGTWDATTTTNWSDTSGGLGGFSAPTSADNVIFDSLSNATAYTVTVGTNAACLDLTATGPLVGNVTFSYATSSRINCYGSFTFLPSPIATVTWSGGVNSLITFRATTTGKTVTTNGVSLQSTSLIFDGVGGGWTLGSAISINVDNANFVVTNGTFNTGNFDITAANFLSTAVGTRTINLGSSTIRVAAGFRLEQTAGLTFNPDTSQIIAGVAFVGAGLTFYNVSFDPILGLLLTITGANTFNNFTINSPSLALGIKPIALGANQTVNGVLTLGTANVSGRRVSIRSDVFGTRRTITLNGSLDPILDTDFRDIDVAGTVATPWTGTRLGNGGNNNNITFDAGKTVYWNLAGTQNLNATAWATTPTGTPSDTNFPLIQDTAVVTEAGAAGTIIINAGYNISTLTFDNGVSTRTSAVTLSFTNSVLFSTPNFFGDLKLSSGVTIIGTPVATFSGSTTQNITSAGKTFTNGLTITSFNGTLVLQDNLTCSATVTLTQGTLDLNNNTLTCTAFSSTNSNTRAIAFGTGNITTTGTGTVWNTGTVTNFSRTGTPTVNISNNSATATTVSTGALTEAQSLNFNYTTGTYTLTDTTSVYRSVNFTGFAGTIPNSTRTIFGSLTISTGMTLTAGANATTFASTAAGNTITSNGKTQDYPLIFNGIGGTFAFQDALTQGSTRAFTITNGTVQLKNGVTSTVGVFATSSTNQKFLQSTTPGSQATLSQASGTINASNLTIQDINAIGGATWNALLSNNNVNGGNNAGWDFGVVPIIFIELNGVKLKSFTQPRRF